jgi:hypothetical protein
VAAVEQGDPFLDDQGSPILRRSALLYIDLLGVKQMAEADGAGQSLVDLESALRRPLGDFLSRASPWPAAFFSDTLVIVDPISNRVSAYTALMGLAVQASWIQLNLAAAGFFLRGALTIGDVHLSDNLLFGPALVDGYDLERKVAVNPRIVLGPEAVKIVRSAMSRYGPKEGGYLRCEQDETVFIDYLDILADDPENPIPSLEAHRDMIRKLLIEHEQVARTWEKYRWVAEYHDSYCAGEFPKAPKLAVAGRGSNARSFKRFEVA